MDDDVIRIIISTDNHLGYLNKDPIRCDDCFASFEEVLIAANEKHADLVLFAGDLFHENKPSRKTVVSTLDLLRKYCTGENSVYLEILNDQTEVFKNTPLKKVNYEDPYYAISLPVFSIHGNHDDPSREGVGTSLAALDILSASNLINYIGKCEQVDDIEITPLLLRKGKTMIALYALGAVRDERLNRMWSQKHVKFIRPKEDQGREKFLNIFVLHQNRDYGRGSKNCVHESMIPDWMDIVIWGNEHECVPNLVESLVGTFRIYQPGSSIATSLCEGESSKYPKHYGLLEVNKEKFRLNTFPYTQIRSFTYQDISLLNEGLDPREPHIEETITTFLTKKVKELIRDARQNLPDLRSANLSINSTTLQTQPKYEIKEPQKVLVKLRVDHSSFPTINQQRFGTQFLGEVANPSELLLLTRKRREYERMLPNGEKLKFDALKISGDTEALSRVRVEDLVTEALENSHKQLGILTTEQLSTALEDFVLKKISNAIVDTTEHALSITQNYLSSDKDIFELCTDKEAILKSAQQFREECINTGTPMTIPRSNITRSTNIEPITDYNDDMELQEDEDNDTSNKNKSKGRGKASTTSTSSKTTTKKTSATSTSTKAKASTKSKTTTTSGRGTTKSKSRIHDDEDEEEEEEFVEQSDNEIENLSDEVENFSSDNDDGNNSDDNSNKKKGKKTTTKAPPKPKATPAPKPTKPTTTTTTTTTAAKTTKTTSKSSLSQKSTPIINSTPAPISSGPRILASGRSQKKSQDIQLSMASSIDIDLSENNHNGDNNYDDGYQTNGKRNRSGAPIPQSSSGLTGGGIAIDLTADDIWSSNARNIPTTTSKSQTRKPPTQLKW